MGRPNFKEQHVPWYVRLLTYFQSPRFSYDSETGGFSNHNVATYSEYKTLFGKSYTFRAATINLDYLR